MFEVAAQLVESGWDKVLTEQIKRLRPKFIKKRILSQHEDNPQLAQTKITHAKQALSALSATNESIQRLSLFKGQTENHTERRRRIFAFSDFLSSIANFARELAKVNNDATDKVYGSLYQFSTMIEDEIANLLKKPDEGNMATNNGGLGAVFNALTQDETIRNTKELWNEPDVSPQSESGSGITTAWADNLNRHHHFMFEAKGASTGNEKPADKTTLATARTLAAESQ